MKKTLYIILALVAAGCNSVELQELVSIPETAVGGVIALIGDAGGENGADSRISVMPADRAGYPCVWNKGDQISMRTASGTVVGTATLERGAGGRSGEFSLSVTAAQPEGTPVRLVYPASRALDFNSQTLSGNQTQSGGMSGNNVLSSDDFAVADVLYSTEETPTRFTLNHILSYIRLVVSSPAFASTRLNNVTISCEGTALAGEFAVDYNSLALTASRAKDAVTVSFDDPVILGEGENQVWFTVLPCDLTGKTVNVTFDITTPYETLSYTKTTTCGKLEQGKAYTIDMRNIDPVPGYCPGDTRMMVGKGHAYGQANTFLIQCKNGSTYANAEYIPNDDIPERVVIDYRVRGDRTTAVLPTDVHFGWAKKDYGITQKMSEAYTPRTQGYTETGVSFADGTWDYVVDRNNFTVTVHNKGSYAGAPILLMLDASNNILWGWTFWNIAADGTRLEQETVGGTWELANMDIGQPTTRTDIWCYNSCGAGFDVIYRMGHRYQWGRYLPVFWQSWNSLCVPGTSYNGNIPAIAGPVDLETSLRHPYGLIAPQLASGASLNDWLSTPDGNLWGNLSTDSAHHGVKSIYDPCPKGWRVPDCGHLKNRRQNEVWKVYDNLDEYDCMGWKGTVSKVGAEPADAMFAACGYFDRKIGNYSATEIRIATMGGAADGSGKSMIWWTNHCSMDSNLYPSFLGTATGSSQQMSAYPGFNDAGSDAAKGMRKASAGYVRCAKDYNIR